MNPEKREPSSTVRSRNAKTIPTVDDDYTEREPKRAKAEEFRASQSEPLDRRVLRSNYLALKTQINDEREELGSVDSNKFERIFSEVENLHQLVQKPREQVADAEALLDIANTLVSSVKTHRSDGLTPSDFVTALLKSFGQPRRRVFAAEDKQVLVKWNDIGLAVSPIFMKGHGIYTMLGPMNVELKQRRTGVQRRRTRPTAETARPDELKGKQEEKSDTDKNMAIMFDILRKRKRVSLESLILNRRSFAQSVENLFALSFLVKDGRAEISLDDNRMHFVLPKNAPAANLIASGEVSYSHFVFKFGFKDWKLMMNVVPEGEELMPHREQPYAARSQIECQTNKLEDALAASQTVPVTDDCEAGLATTPIRKLTRNKGRVVHFKAVVEEFPK